MPEEEKKRDCFTREPASSSRRVDHPSAFEVPNMPPEKMVLVDSGEQYVFLDDLGSGGFAKVKRAIHYVTGEQVAIKIMDKESLGDDISRVRLEIAAMKEFTHQNICRLYQVIETSSRMYLVLEYCPGGELFDYIVEKERLSEDEARRFFRQIVSAVGYVHSKGYAHRDLKPENLLLDVNRNLKLIDFGLCAKPQGGLETNLKTFCGSPAYAAPEIISGQEYIGPMVDVWSMGVLLYTLLCGCLPFDDDNLAVLYGKIQDGDYDTPPWLSESSLELLAEMMNLVPEYRISVTQLLNHPWLVNGYGIPVSIESSTYQLTVLDDEVVTELAVGCGRSKSSVAMEISKWKYNYMTSTYLLLLLQKSQGRVLRLKFPDTYPKKKMSCSRKLTLDEPVRAILLASPLRNSLENGLDDSQLLSLGSPLKSIENDSSIYDPDASPIQEQHMQPVLPDDMDSSDKENFVQPRVPTPKRKTTKAVQEAAVLAVHSSANISGQATPVTKIRSPSADAEFRLTPLATPNGDRSAMASSVFRTPVVPGRLAQRCSSAKRVFGSIERGLDKMRKMLTPRRKIAAATAPLDAPRTVEVMQNVSTIPDVLSPEQVVDSLRAALLRKGIMCKEDGYTLRGKVRDEWGKVQLTFDLEVVQVQQPGLLGILRKRLKGSAWHYKRVCEEVLRIRGE